MSLTIPVFELPYQKKEVTLHFITGRNSLEKKLNNFKTEGNPLIAFKGKTNYLWNSISEDSTFLDHGTRMNSFVNAFNIAYNYHQPIEISPDDVRTVILQSLSQHINYEGIAKNWVNFEGKKTINVERNDFTKNGPNPWDEVIPAIIDGMSNEMKSENLIEFTRKEFSTSSENSMLVASIATMEAMKEVFEYRI